MRGLFIVIEGCDAAGKDVQSDLLAKHLNAERFRFPDRSTPIGGLIDLYLKREWEADWRLTRKLPDGRLQTLTNDNRQLDALVFQALQAANRLEALPRILYARRFERNIVCTRYWQSGVVYGALDGLDTVYLEALHSTLPKPDLNILLDIDCATMLARKPADQRDRYEADLVRTEAVVSGYRDFWHRKIGSGDRSYVVVDGRSSVEKVALAILAAAVLAYSS